MSINTPLASQSWKIRHRRQLSPHFLKNSLLVLLILFVAGSIGVLGVFAYVSRDLPNPNILTQRTIKQSTKIYDRTGQHLLYEIYNDQNRTLVKLSQGFCNDNRKLPTDPNGIPLYAVEATITAEDRSFCQHYGFDPKGILRAMWDDLRGQHVGGSTLTQQLVKNAILSNEKTLTRKIKELILSIELERRYSKDEILQIYFNEIPYGSTYYGIQAASTNFFGKPVKDLTLPEAATLAAIPQLPTYYINNPDKLRARRDWILDGMAGLGYITKDQASAAKATDTPLQQKVGSITAPHFVFYVKSQLEQIYGQQAVEEGGLNVITSLDYDLQKKAEKAVEDGVDARGKIYHFDNAALVAEDPKTAQILAMVGSKDYFDDSIDGQVNVALRPRQPGSSFKPIVYTKAFSMGYTPNTILWDVNTTFPTPTGPYQPHDYDLKQRGPITVRNALQGSLNLPAVEMMYLVGVNNALDFADQLGYTTFGDRSRFGLSVVLGGGEVTLLDHTNAYATLDDDGIRHDPVSILSVTDSNGSILQQWHPTDGQAVIDPNVAHTTTNVLSDNNARAFIFGAHSPLTLGDIPAAAKTGTTNNNNDGWTMGYVPSLVAGVWAGNTDNSPMSAKADGSFVAGPIWNEFMVNALQGKAIDQFPTASIPLTGKPVLDGQMPGTHVIIDRASGKQATQYTPPSYREDRLYAEYHTILQYVDRNDPLGPPPANPQEDPYFQPWEDAVQSWVASEEAVTGIQLSNESPPTGYDDLHVPANFPTVVLQEPQPDSVLPGRTIDMTVSATAPRGISRVEFYADGKILETVTSPPYHLHLEAPGELEIGVHTLKAVAYDDIDNSSSVSVNVTLSENASGGVVSVTDPAQDQVIKRDVDTFNIALSIEQSNEFSSVTAYAEAKGTGKRETIGTKTLPDSPFIQIPWVLPASGDWVLSATGTLKAGETVQTAGVMVHVQPGSAAAPGSPPETPLSPFPPLAPPPT